MENYMNEIMLKYGTDKNSYCHNYVEKYVEYFEPLKEKEIKILEIGIYRPPTTDQEPGASLKTWYEYFPKAKIYGVDVNVFTDVENDRIKTIVANQELRENNGIVNGLKEIIDTFGGDFDIIIDDGGHTMIQQQITLGYMFKYLKPGGLFVIEDLHTSYFAPWAYNQTNTELNTLVMLKNYINNKSIDSDFMFDSEKEYLNETIDFMDLHKAKESEIVFIKKK
jgi:hypothetical protein